MVWVGAAIVIATFWLIYKNYEPRLVLFLSGLVMLILGQYIVGSKIDITTGMTAFVKTLVNGGLVPTFTTVMGFRLCDELHEMFRSYGQCHGSSLNEGSGNRDSGGRHYHLDLQYLSSLGRGSCCFCRRPFDSGFGGPWR